MLKKLRNNNGMAAFVAIMMMVMLTMIGVASIKLANDEVTIAGNEMNSTEAFYIAEAGLEQGVAALETSFEETNAPPDNLPYSSGVMGDCVMAFQTTVIGGGGGYTTLSQGPFQGLQAEVESYTVTSMGYSMIDKSQTTLSEEFESFDIPIMQFYIFYEEMMQVNPAFDMTINGRVHSNNDMWLNGYGALEFTKRVTSAGSIYHGLENGTEGGAPSNVLFTDADGNAETWKNGSGWIDATDANWYDSATTKWDGNVRDKAFGQEGLTIPMENGADIHDAIERSNGGANPNSLETLAEFKIIDGVPFSKVGAVWVNVSAPLAGIVISDGSEDFGDRHEKKTVSNTEIDINALKSSGYYPTNGVIYVSDQRSLGGNEMYGVTIANGSDIGNDGVGLTFVSENPVYIEGDFNTTTKQPAAVISDACTFLSNDWAATNKANSSNPQYTSRPVTAKTSYNLALITGDLEPTGTNYGGGVENLPRLLEDWGGQEMEFLGSLACLWKSEQATSDYQYVGNPGYYSAPTRNWGYDADFEDPANHPPESPMARGFQRIGWREEDIEYVTTNR